MTSARKRSGTKHGRRFSRIGRAEALEVRRVLAIDVVGADGTVSSAEPAIIIGEDADPPVDVLPPVVSQTSQTYDEQGRIASLTEEIDKDGDGIVEYRQITNFGYDD